MKFPNIFYIFFFIILAVFFIKFFLAAVVLVLALLWLRTWQMKGEPNHREFLHGKLPNPKPDGFYRGNIGFEVSWIGKKFDGEHETGINLFENKKARHNSAPGFGIVHEKYPFATSVGRGLFDEKLFVLKIDYNVKGNPFWIRCILDEIVEIAPNKYLGKMHLRIIPGFPFSVLYFELKK